ncbi:hypothetical protein CRE_06652 [Caenorhabditis remanei]|uniref:Uncharacterized protein n=1 Tax=Caenorhabditis remanei TaxID=31234 RepID=E3M1Z8_CAERE|nr:hypothetical protein CRE_06652 [Caenorhabditis remanei]
MTSRKTSMMMRANNFIPPCKFSIDAGYSECELVFEAGGRKIKRRLEDLNSAKRKISRFLCSRTFKELHLNEDSEWGVSWMSTLLRFGSGTIKTKMVVFEKILCNNIAAGFLKRCDTNTLECVVFGKKQDHNIIMEASLNLGVKEWKIQNYMNESNIRKLIKLVEGTASAKGKMHFGGYDALRVISEMVLPQLVTLNKAGCFEFKLSHSRKCRVTKEGMEYTVSIE